MKFCSNSVRQILLCIFVPRCPKVLFFFNKKTARFLNFHMQGFFRLNVKNALKKIQKLGYHFFCKRWETNMIFYKSIFGKIRLCITAYGLSRFECYQVYILYLISFERRLYCLFQAIFCCFLRFIIRMCLDLSDLLNLNTIFKIIKTNFLGFG